MLSYGLAQASKGSSRNVLVVVRDFDDTGAFVDALRRDPQNPFSDVLELPGNFSTKTRLRMERYLVQSKNVLRLRPYLKEALGERGTAHVFNDSRAEGQAVLHYNRSHGGTNCYVEDGLGAYSQSRFRKANAFEHVVTKLLFGRHYQLVEVNGLHPLFDRHLVLLPERVREELRGKDLVRLEGSILLGTEAYCRQLLAALHPSGKVPKSVLLLPSSESLPKSGDLSVPTYYGQVAVRMAERYGEVGVKFHPRENREEMFTALGDPRIVKLSKSLPIEALLIPNRDAVKLLVGDLSTSMMTGRLILGEGARVVSTSGVEGLWGTSETDKDLLRKIGVEVPPSLDERVLK